MTKFHKFEYVGPEKENIGHEKNTIEEKKYFSAKNDFGNSIKKMWVSLIKVKF